MSKSNVSFSAKHGSGLSKPGFCSQIQELSRPDSLRDFRLRTQHYAAERDAQIARASRALEHINSVRIPWAQAMDLERKVEEIHAGLAALRRDNDKSWLFLLSYIHHD